MTFLDPDHLRSDLENLLDDEELGAKARSHLSAFDQPWFHDPRDAFQRNARKSTLVLADRFVREALRPARGEQSQ